MRLGFRKTVAQQERPSGRVRRTEAATTHIANAPIMLPLARRDSLLEYMECRGDAKER